MITLEWDHPAMLRDKPMFPSRIRSARQVTSCLKLGQHNTKLGSRWSKIWKGMPIYTLTLTERATCPACPARDFCYGNGMPSAIRLKPDRYLMPRLSTELIGLAAAHPDGFSVRLHVLGDFYSETYANFWIDQVRRFDNLHVFGFTSWPRDQPIGAILERESVKWDRLRLRFSVEGGARSAVVMDELAEQEKYEGIICPYESGKKRVKDCASCGLCLSTQKPIVFAQH